jgi:bifunctional non-homologous end joining protein LigD
MARQTASTLPIRTDGRTIELSRPGKPLFPSGITKADLARYYERVAPVMLTHVAERPLNLQRYPDGIEHRGLFQQQIGRYFPDWIGRATVPKEGGEVTHVLADDAATLVYLAGQACVTLHAWPVRADRIDRPDRMIIDLDPSGGTPDDVRAVALETGALLRELGLTPFALATGSRGYHVVVPLRRRLGFDVVRAFARDVGRAMVLRDASGAERVTLEQRKAKRAGRILIDVMRNTYGHTSVAPYSVRARPEATVATPLHWDELEDPHTRPDAWTLRTLPRRLQRDGDPWREIATAASGLSGPRRRLDALLRELSGERP